MSGAVRLSITNQEILWWRANSRRESAIPAYKREYHQRTLGKRLSQANRRGKAWTTTKEEDVIDRCSGKLANDYLLPPTWVDFPTEGLRSPSQFEREVLRPLTITTSARRDNGNYHIEKNAANEDGYLLWRQRRVWLRRLRKIMPMSVRMDFADCY